MATYKIRTKLKITWIFDKNLDAPSSKIFWFLEPDLPPPAGTTDPGWAHPCPGCHLGRRQQGPLCWQQVNNTAAQVEQTMELVTLYCCCSQSYMFKEFSRLASNLDCLQLMTSGMMTRIVTRKKKRKRRMRGRRTIVAA